MSLFDNVKIQTSHIPFPKEMYELKDWDFAKENWQTKDLGCTYNGFFFIKKHKGKNHLYHRQFEYIWKKSTGKKQKDIFDMGGHMEKVGEEDILVNHRGPVNIYAYIQNDEFENDYFVDVNLFFDKNSILDPKVTSVTIEKTDNAERKKKDKEWAAKNAKYIAFTKTWRGKAWSKYRKIKRKLCWPIQRRIISSLEWLTNKIRIF